MARNTEQGRWKVKQYGGSSSKPRPFEGKGLSYILRGRFFPAVPPPKKSSSGVPGEERVTACAASGQKSKRGHRHDRTIKGSEKTPPSAR